MDKDSKLQLHTGRSIPVFGLGTWGLINDTAGSVLYALDLGYCLIDTSTSYCKSLLSKIEMQARLKNP